MLVDAPDVTAAIALQTTIQQLALVAGPALAGVLIATIGLGAVYGIDVVSFSVALVAVLFLPPLVPRGGGTPLGLRSMAEGFRHLRHQRLLSATYWIDLNAMIFGMPRAVFPALGTGLFGGGAGGGGLALCRARSRCPRGVALHGVVWPGPSSGPGHRGLRRHLGGDDRAVRRHPRTGRRVGALALAGAADVISAVFRQAVQQRAVPQHLQGRLSGTFFAVVAGGPRSATPRPVWLPPSAARSLPCGQAVWPVLGVAVLVWLPSFWRDAGGGHPLGAQAQTEAIAQATSELGEGEPL